MYLVIIYIKLANPYMTAEQKLSEPIGLIGLGKMGIGLAGRMVDANIPVVAYDLSEDARNQAQERGATGVESLAELTANLPKGSRRLWLMLPHEVVDQTLNQLTSMLHRGDLVVDGGNSFWEYALQRSALLQEEGIEFMDVGVSGGPGGARDGACIMGGGSQENYDRMVDAFKAMAAPDAYMRVGEIGAGHFTKMVHNGIEYAMMQAIAEGVKILSEAPPRLGVDPVHAFEIYQRRSVIESRLVGWQLEALKEDAQLEGYPNKVGATGEGLWTVETARKLGIDLPAIELAVKVRNDSQNNPREDIMFRALQSQRYKFGGHTK